MERDAVMFGEFSRKTNAKITEGKFALGAITIFALGLFVALSGVIHPGRFAPQVASDQSLKGLKSEKGIHGGNEASTTIHQKDLEKAPEQGENEGTEFWPSFLGLRVKITDSMLAAFTLGLLIFTGLLWRSTEKLWVASEKQFGLLAETSASQSRDMQESIKAATHHARAVHRSAEIAERTLIWNDRAWIDFKIKIVGPPVFRADGCDIHLAASLKNVGRTPALQIYSDYRTFSVLDNAKKRLDELKQKAKHLTASTSYGPTLFPDGIIEEPCRSFEISRSDVKKSAELDEKHEFVLYVVGCTYYFLPGDGSARFTTFFQELIRTPVKPFDFAQVVYEPPNVTSLGGALSETS